MKKATILLLLVAAVFTSCTKSNPFPDSGKLIIDSRIAGYEEIVEDVDFKIYDGEGTTGYLVAHQIVANPMVSEYNQLSVGTYTIVSSWLGENSRLYTDIETVYLGTDEQVRVNLILE